MTFEVKLVGERYLSRQKSDNEYTTTSQCQARYKTCEVDCRFFLSAVYGSENRIFCGRLCCVNKQQTSTVERRQFYGHYLKIHGAESTNTEGATNWITCLLLVDASSNWPENLPMVPLITIKTIQIITDPQIPCYGQV